MMFTTVYTITEVLFKNNYVCKSLRRRWI